MPELIVLLHAAALAMVGLIWYVQNMAIDVAMECVASEYKKPRN